MPSRQHNFIVPKHISMNHNDKAKNVLSRGKDAESKEVFSCDQCGKSCVNSTNLMWHKTKCLQDKEKKEVAEKETESYCCQPCNHKFSNKPNLIWHEKKCLQDIEQKEVAKKQAESYWCQHCNHRFSNKHNLLQHINAYNVSDKTTEQTGSDKGKEVKPGTKDKILVQQRVSLFCKGLFDDEDQLAKHSLTWTTRRIKTEHCWNKHWYIYSQSKLCKVWKAIS